MKLLLVSVAQRPAHRANFDGDFFAAKRKKGDSGNLSGEPFVKHYQLHVSLRGFMTFSKPDVLNIAVTGLSL